MITSLKDSVPPIVPAHRRCFWSGRGPDDFYDTYRINYGYFGGKMVGIPFDCDIQMVHVRNSVMEKVLGGPVDRPLSIPTYEELTKASAEANKLGGGVAGIGLLGLRGFWSI